MLKWFFPNFWFAAFMGIAFMGYVSSHQKNELIAELEHLEQEMVPAKSCAAIQQAIASEKTSSRLPASVSNIKEKELLLEITELHKVIFEQNTKINALSQGSIQNIVPQIEDKIEEPAKVLPYEQNLSQVKNMVGNRIKDNWDLSKVDNQTNCYTEEKNCIMENEDDFRNTNNMVFCKTTKENCRNQGKEETEELL